ATLCAEPGSPLPCACVAGGWPRLVYRASEPHACLVCHRRDCRERLADVYSRAEYQAVPCGGHGCPASGAAVASSTQTHCGATRLARWRAGYAAVPAPMATPGAAAVQHSGRLGSGGGGVCRAVARLREQHACPCSY